MSAQRQTMYGFLLILAGFVAVVVGVYRHFDLGIPGVFLSALGGQMLGQAHARKIRK